VNLDDLQKTIEKVAGEVGPRLVGVGDRWALGSGVIVGSGTILTNAHNVRGDEVTVTFNDGTTAAASPKGVDVDADVAVLSVATNGAAPIEWSGDGPQMAIGAPVFALANPGGRGLRVTFGLISGTERSFRGPRGRRIGGSLEHTAPLLPGSSGGPVVDASGRFLGLNTNRLGEGFYLAIPADAALKQRVEALSRGESAARPRLGVGIAPPQVARRLRRAVGLPEADGLLIRVVEERSPAAEAGLEEGDLLTEAAGRPLADADQLYEALDATGGNGSLQLKVLRGSEERSVAVSLSAQSA
jgi:serine protease Do